MSFPFGKNLWKYLLPVAALLPLPAFGQALADHVPADAVIYLGWRGTADLGTGYDDSHLKSVLAKSQVDDLLHKSLPALFASVDQNAPQVAPYTDMVAEIVPAIWSHPCAFFVSDLGLSRDDPPHPKVAILCETGNDDDATKLQQTLTNSVANAPIKIFVDKTGTLVSIATFDGAGTAPDQTLAADSDFKTALGQVHADCVLTGYFDLTKIISQLDTLVAQPSMDKESAEKWPLIKDALGLNGFHRIIVSEGFSGKDWLSQAFIDAPVPRVGLSTLVNGTPLDKDLLHLIPAASVMAGAGSFDLGDFVKQVRIAATRIDPDTGKQLDQGFQQINSTIGFDVEADLLDEFGTQWAFYVDPTTAGYGPLGAVILNRPRDPDKLGTSLGKLEDMANGFAGPALHNIFPLLTLQFKHDQVAGVDLHYLEVPLITPSWAIANGTWYFGLYPQVVVSAAKGAPTDALIDSAAWLNLRKNLGGPDDITGFGFVDIPKLAPLSYQSLLMYSRLLLGAGDLVGLDSPPLVLPTLGDIVPDLEPAGAVSWVDDSGWHSNSISAFPGDALFSIQGSPTDVLPALISAGTAARQGIAVPTPVAPPPNGGL